MTLSPCFDWYQATVLRHAPPAVCSALQNGFDLADLAPARPQHGYQRGAEVKRGSATLARIWFDGNPGVHVQGSGPNSEVVAQVLRDLGEHRVTRADVCLDWHQSGLFDRLAYGLIAYALDHDITIIQQGDWERGQSRTLYLGGPKAAVRLVLYEKGWEQRAKGYPDAPLEWTRLEVRVRPEKEARVMVSTWAPSRFLGAARWLSGALAHVGLGQWAAQVVTKGWRPSETERARAACLRAYGRTLADWAAEVGGERLWDCIVERLESGQ
jgi:hypothetical protein